MSMLSDLKKNFRLPKIMARIAPPNERFDPSKFLNETLASLGRDGKKTEKQQAEEDLFELVVSDPGLSAILREHGATRADVEAAYRKLCEVGAGQWVKGAYVAAAAIATKPSLRHILTKIQKPSECKDSNKWMRLASDLIIYFEQ